MRWNSAFFEIFETVSGWWWYLRMPDHSAIAQAAKHYPTLDEAKESTLILPGAVDAAVNVQPLVGGLKSSD